MENYITDFKQLVRDVGSVKPIMGKGLLLSKTKRFSWLCETYKYEERETLLMLNEIKNEFAELQKRIQLRDEERAAAKREKDEARKSQSWIT